MRRVSATWVVLLQWLVATTTPAGCGAAPEVPNVAVQYGPFRSASTLQYQMLCAIMFLVHGDDGDVECSFLSRVNVCLLYTSPSPRDGLLSRMPSSA